MDSNKQIDDLRTDLNNLKADAGKINDSLAQEAEHCNQAVIKVEETTKEIAAIKVSRECLPDMKAATEKAKSLLSDLMPILFDSGSIAEDICDVMENKGNARKILDSLSAEDQAKLQPEKDAAWAEINAALSRVENGELQKNKKPLGDAIEALNAAVAQLNKQIAEFEKETGA